MIYEYDAFIEVPEKLGEDKMAELDCAIAYFVEDRFGFPVEFSIVGQVNEKSGDCEIEKVVRCKDCKHWKGNDEPIPWSDDNVFVEVPCETKPMDFCSMGERKEDNER